MKKAVFAGTFDPITLGHLTVIKKASRFFDELIVLIANNPAKQFKYSVEERLNFIKESTKDFKNVTVDYTDGLTVDYAKAHDAKYLVRGVRNNKDFGYESELYHVNKILNPEIETIFFVAEETEIDISSSKVRELINSGADLSKMVPNEILKSIK